jgi:hypothetical protein
VKKFAVQGETQNREVASIPERPIDPGVQFIGWIAGVAMLNEGFRMM